MPISAPTANKIRIALIPIPIPLTIPVSISFHLYPFFIPTIAAIQALRIRAIWLAPYDESSPYK